MTLTQTLGRAYGLSVLAVFAFTLIRITQPEEQLTQEDLEYLAESRVGMESQL